MNARREELALPPDVAVDAQGESTQDAPRAAALRPLGGADYGQKGDGPALIVELLCGPLNGIQVEPGLRTETLAWSERLNVATPV